MKKILLASLFLLGFSLNAQAEEMFELSEQCKDDVMNMIKCKVAEDVSADDAIESMKLRANFLNFKLVGHLPLSEQVKANGGESNRMEIFQFCDANIAAKMVKHSMAFAGYLPCRISLVLDDAGQAWLITLNMDSTMGDASLPKVLQGLGMTVRNNIYSIISAGAEGDL
ncbi:MAG: DUF302 domain-containing protein [Gammaproteobacteria bacterium]|jgi:uncharacterized protein (DUF302 family)|nr:DUF302 domain-containing protein [Gammaproteobacteria bacterium]MBT3725403.1 DUF302 domain-containing protein [Gammaproteobacteria bacterium]MBT4076690.1 DUF302 domain-containing protein [Gammaproteobacteria bacterium]MBT4193973.1 DUF302 domain-containing protein [Gammaproteobacteria bacterium]MBT4448351.1 DUF302 domain-containing protein [Gammaproteobacteria bacterium]